MGFLFRWLMMGFHQVSWRKWLILYVDFTRKTMSLSKSSIRGMKQDQWLIIPILICIKHRRLIGGILYNSARSVDVAQLGVNHVKLFCLNVCVCVFLLLLCFLVLLFYVQCTWSNCRHIMLDYSNAVMKLGLTVFRLMSAALGWTQAIWRKLVGCAGGLLVVPLLTSIPRSRFDIGVYQEYW